MNSLHNNQGGESVKIALDGSQVVLPAQHRASVSLTFTPIRLGLCFFCYKLLLLFLYPVSHPLKSQTSLAGLSSLASLVTLTCLC